ncbi:T9SS type A sorting domain-containing protein [Chryseobacterium viscerum]|uniref:T9SS type A sorting domain-containing protein n=1 Tax=Chryseobacterium viscerum TaxID=1037377 RepID=A0A5N4BNR4_9FLAO|nr:T9SS type A sorting domain-containing protein [Chryseobacterium viscerum]KAB1230057.1 T9SS type A sorting domain-containing protein [Chryseobacterium viscerum]
MKPYFIHKILPFLGLFISLNFFSQENLLDTSYGLSGGYTDFAFYNGSQMSGGLQIHATTKLPDGKVLAVGAGFIARFTSNGVLDTSVLNGYGYKLFSQSTYGRIKPAGDGNYIVMDYGFGGVQKIDADGNFVNGFTSFNQGASYVDIDVDESGRIYLLKHSNYNYTLVRLLPNGTVDTAFGNNGIATLGTSYRYGRVRVNTNNEIFIAGLKIVATNSDQRIVVTKILPDGALDSSFGASGNFLYQYGQNAGTSAQLMFLDNGKILGLSSGSICNGNNCFGLITYRLNANGTLDTTFKNTGIAVIPVQSDSTPMKMVRLPDNTFMISGTGWYNTYVLKMDENGNLDNSFGLNGKIITPQMLNKNVYNSGFELYGNSIVLFGIYSIWYGAQTQYVGTARKYFFNTSSLGVSDVALKTVKIYPNPVKDFLHLTSKEKITGYEISDLNGRKIINAKADFSEEKINLSFLSSGTYMITVHTSKGTVSSKFIKK